VSIAAMRLVALDSLRGVAALMVVLLHINAVSHMTEWTLVRQGWLCVDFFFVLSGFVIAFAYLDKIESWPSLLEFVIRRFGRVWPLHAVLLLLFVGSELLKLALSYRGFPTHEPPFGGRYAVDAIAANLLLVHSLGFYGLETWNGPSWSISVEFYTYLVFALACLFARRRISVVASGLIALALAVLCRWSPAYLQSTVAFGLERCLYGFFMGVLTALAFRALRGRGWTVPLPTAVEGASVALVVALILACGESSRATLLAPPLFAVVVLVFGFESGALSRLLLRRAFTWLGDRSYSIYMVHALVIELVNRGLLVAGGLTGLHAVTRMAVSDGMADVVFIHDRFATDAFVLAYVGVVLALTDLAHRTVEQPGRRFFNHLARVYRQSQTIAPAEAAVSADARPAE